MKSFAKKHESGMTVSTHFLSNCRPTVCKDLNGEGSKGLLIAQAGPLDKGMKTGDLKLDTELWVSRRLSWVQAANICSVTAAESPIRDSAVPFRCQWLLSQSRLPCDMR
jgi:hypothetical protein